MRRRYYPLPALLAMVALGAALLHRATDDPVLRTVAIGYGPTSAAVVEQTGRVFISTIALNGGVVVLNSTTGEQIGSVPMAPLPISTGQGTSSIESEGGRVTLYRPPNQILALDPRTGAALRRPPPGPGQTTIGGKPAHTLAFAPDDSALFVRAAGGALVGRVSLPRTLVGISISVRFRRVYASTSGGMLLVIDAYHGRLLRTVQLPVSAGTLYMSAGTGHFFALAPGTVDYMLVMLDAASGNVLHVTKTGVAVPAADTLASLPGLPPLLLDSDEATGQFMLTSQASDRVRLFSTRTGLLVGTVPIGSHPTAWAIDGHHQHLLVATTNATMGRGYPTGHGTLWVIDLRHDHVIDTVPIGAEPIAVLLDARTHRAFIVNANVNPDFTPLIIHPRQSWWDVLSSQFHQLLPFLPTPPIPTSTGTVTVVDLDRL